MLGLPRLHLRRTDSTNDRARALAEAGAPHGTLVTAAEQTAGRGRQGRTWTAPPGRALLATLVLRDWPRLLPLAAAVAVADAVTPWAGPGAGRVGVKWPNDVLLDERKLAGILVEARPQERWAVLGIGLNVAVVEGDLPSGLRAGAGSLGLAPGDVETVLQALLGALARRLAAREAEVLDALRARDALAGREIRWAGGDGRADGIDDDGRLLVVRPDGSREALAAGEVHLERR